MQKRRDLTASYNWWGDAQKLEAVQTYLMLGTIKLTSAACEIPEKTLYMWRNTAWWQEITDELRLQDKLQLSQKLKKIIASSLDVAQDRLDKGEWEFDRDGKPRRRPVSLRDAHKVALEMVNKKEEILATEKVIITDAKVEDTLRLLAEKFAALADRVAEKPPVQVTDVIYMDSEENANALPDQRETGLQETVREV